MTDPTTTLVGPEPCRSLPWAGCVSGRCCQHVEPGRDAQGESTSAAAICLRLLGGKRDPDHCNRSGKSPFDMGTMTPRRLGPVMHGQCCASTPRAARAPRSAALRRSFLGNKT